MNTKWGSSLVVLAAILSAGVAGAALAADSKPATVAQFVDHLSTLMKSQPFDSKGPEGVGRSAAWQEVNASMPLTYGEVSRIASELGVRVAPPADPDAIVSVASAGVIANQIAAVHMARSKSSVPPEGPTECLNSNNRGACVDCCKDKTGEGGKFCGRYCHANVPPPPSPEEPLP